MSLPPFLFSSAAPTAPRSAFTSATSTASAVTADEGRMSAGQDFRQAFMQVARDNTPSAGTQVSPQESVQPLTTKLTLLFEGDVLPDELQEHLRGLLADLQQDAPIENSDGTELLADVLQTELTEDQLDAVIAVLQDGVANVSMAVHQSPDASVALRKLVDLLTGGKTLPMSASSNAMNLSEVPNVVAEVSLDMPHKTLSADASVEANNLAAGSTKSTQGDLLSLKPDVLAGANKSLADANVTIKPETAASPLGTILPPDLESPESLSSHAALATPASSKGGMIAGLQAPAEAQMNPAMRVQVAFGHAQWSEALAERAAWLAGQQIHTAELQLDPPELGPMQVRISVHQDQVVVSFVSANPQVREALDQSMMRLRELLQEHGMQLVDAGVSDQQRGGNGETADGEAATGVMGGSISDETPENGQAPGETIDTRYGVDDFV